MAGVASCSGQALTMAMCKESHAGCDACEDMGTFDAELTSASAAVQVVPIKNGVMFVYSALLVKLNRSGLPSAIRVRGTRLGMLLFCVAFYGFFAGWYVIVQMGELF